FGRDQLRRLGRIICLEPALLAGVASQSQHAARRQLAKQPDQLLVSAGKKVRIGKLRQLITKTAVVERNLMRGRAHIDRQLGDRWLGCCRGIARGGKATSVTHRANRSGGTGKQKSAAVHEWALQKLRTARRSIARRQM